MNSQTVPLVYIVFIGNFYVVLSQRYNTIPSPIQLSTRHEPQITSKVCLLKPEEGPCRGSISMYYFDPSTKQCSTFYWGGCQGNGNRFDTKFQCEKTCLSQSNAPNTKPRYCQLTFDYGFCFGSVKRWYYDRMWKVCKETIYSGCGGNKNNFYSYEQCDSICRLAKGSLTDVKKKGPGGVRKVVYVFTNGTRATRWTAPEAYRSTATSPRPRQRP